MRILVILLMLYLNSCKGQSTRNPVPSPLPTSLVGGGCDGCELIFTGMPVRMAAADTSAGWREAGRRLLVRGVVYKGDGSTPAKDVILYYWQTDHKGYYSPAPGMPANAARHGHIRGWVKTDSMGRYAIFTNRPEPYPGEQIPAHIHVVVKEPGLNEYYIDDMVFDDDRLLNSRERRKLEGRGGSGILRLKKGEGFEIGERNIILGLNIPGHPSKVGGTAPDVGEEQPSFMPFHVWGPDKGSNACPVCKYGKYPGLILFVGSSMKEGELKKWLLMLEEESEELKPLFKAYVVCSEEWMDGSRFAAIGRELGIRNLALTTVPSYADTTSEVYLNMIDPEKRSTMILYKNRIIVDKRFDMIPDSGLRIPD